MVYFVLCKRDGLIKIGFSKDVLARAMNHRSEARSNVTILGTIEGGRREEKALHVRFDSILARGREWFHPHAELLEYIRNVTTPWPESKPVGLERDEEYWQRLEKPSPKVSGAGPRLKSNLYRMMNDGLIPKSQKAIAAMVREKTGRPLGHQKLSLLLNSATIEMRFVEQIASGIGCTPDDLLR